MIIRQLPILVGIIALCCSSCARAADVSVLIGKLADLPGKSLAISSTLNIVYFDTGKTVSYDIEEMQSGWQKRSKVHYRGKQPQERWQVEADLAESGTFVVDESRALLISEQDNTGRRVCKQVDLATANKLFNLNKLDGYARQMHLMGAARILSLLGENLDSVKPTTAPTKPGLGPMRPIKDTVSFAYTYDQHTIVAHYSADSAHNLAQGVPLELVVSPGDLASQNMVLFYDFRKVRALDEGLNLGDGSQASKQLLGKSVAGPQLDMFAVDRAIGCSRPGAPQDDQKSQSDGDRLPPLKGLARAHYRFSFGAKPTLQSTEGKRTLLKVAYEPSIDTLKVARSNELVRASTTTNYLTGLTYHVLDKRTHSENIQKIVPAMGDREQTGANPDDEPAPKWSCVVTKATVRAGEQSTSGGGGSAGASENPYALGEMLLGIQPNKASQVRYLGLARVRGIDARMYELWNSTWPVWFQAPLVYHESRNWIGVASEAMYRSSTGGQEDRGTTWNTVVYLSGTGGGGRNKSWGKQDDLTSGNLLLIEMTELDTRTLRVRQRATFSIYDFAWYFTGASHSTGDTRTEEFLSLGDTCLSRDDNQYGRLDMMLTAPSETNEMTAWLRASSRRNFAIMQAAQRQMGLPASAIYDLESRLELDASKQTFMAVSLRTAERVRAVNQLIYLGRGNFKSGPNELRKDLVHTLAYSFQACYLMVAHRRMDTVFAFRPADGRCYVHTNRVIGTVKQTVSGLFDMLDWGKTTEVTRGTLEVYRVRHDGAPWSSEPPKSALARAESLLGALSSVDLLNDLSVDYDEGGQLAVKTKLVSFQVSELDAKIAPRAKSEQVDPETGEPPATSKFDTNKFEGLGLVASDETSTLVEPERQQAAGGEDDGERAQLAKIVQVVNEMTFGQCQTQCLLDIDCGSFSWCVREGRTECVLSRINFKQPMLASQLIELQSKRAAKFGQIFSLQTKGTDQEAACARVQIRKHPACELHNKQFMQLFRLSEPPRVRFDLAEMKLYPVGHRDDCAKICLDRTLGVLKSDVGPAKQASLSALLELTAETSERSLKKLFQEHKDAHSRICTAFSFYNRANFLALGDAKMNRLARRVASSQDTPTSGSGVDNTSQPAESTGGYCLLGDLQTDAKRKQMDKEEATMAENARRRSSGDSEDSGGRIVVTLEQFAFDFRFMFDRQYGVSLRKTPVYADVETALSAAVRGQLAHVSAHEFELLREFVRNGDNNVHWMSTVLTGGGPANCARLCFLQQVPLWPGCKSFAHLERAAVFSNQKITLCVFNSVSLRETLLRERLDLVRDTEAESREPQNNGSQQQQQPQPPMIVWHYEPKPSFVSDALDWARAVEAASSERLDDDGATGGLSNTGGVRLGAFGMFLCSLIGISLGVLFGLKIGEQTIVAHGSRAREDTEDLVDSIHGVEMSPGENGGQRGASIEFSDLMAMEPPPPPQREHDNEENE